LGPSIFSLKNRDFPEKKCEKNLGTVKIPHLNYEKPKIDAKYARNAKRKILTHVKKMQFFDILKSRISDNFLLAKNFD
jgi:hypothetical protein